MANFQKTVKALRNAHLANQKLLEAYKEFAAHARAALLKVPPVVDGMRCSDLGPDGQFTVLFAGRSLEFGFSSAFNPKGSLVGWVTSYLVGVGPDFEREQVASLEFNQKGDTEMIDESDDNDPINITVPGCALHVVFDMLETSMGFEAKNVA